MSRRRLGFIKADTITLSNHKDRLFLRCTTLAGDSGSGLILKMAALLLVIKRPSMLCKEGCNMSNLSMTGLQRLRSLLMLL